MICRAAPPPASATHRLARRVKPDRADRLLAARDGDPEVAGEVVRHPLQPGVGMADQVHLLVDAPGAGPARSRRGPRPSASHATLLRIVLGSARKFRRSPLVVSKKATVAWKSGAGLSSATAMVVPSGDQLGPPWYDSGSSTEASRRSLDASRSKSDQLALLLGVHVAPERDPLAVGREGDARVDVEGALARRAAERRHLERARGSCGSSGLRAQVEEVVAVGRERSGPRGRHPAAGRTSTSLPVATWRTRSSTRPGRAGEVREVAAVGRDRALSITSPRLVWVEIRIVSNGAARRRRGSRRERPRRPPRRAQRATSAAADERAGDGACAARQRRRRARARGSPSWRDAESVSYSSTISRSSIARSFIDWSALVGALGEAAPDQPAQLGGHLRVQLLDRRRLRRGGSCASSRRPMSAANGRRRVAAS